MACRSEITRPLVSLVVLLLLFTPAAAVAAGPSPTEDAPVRGGIAALSDAIPIAPVPDRARFLAEAIRVVYSWPPAGPYSNEPMRRRMAAFFASANTSGLRDEVPVPLTATEFSLLRYFMLNPRRVLSKTQILMNVWRYDFGGNSNVVETYVSYLRKKLDAHGPPLIRTVRQAGYMLEQRER